MQTNKKNIILLTILIISTLILNQLKGYSYELEHNILIIGYIISYIIYWKTAYKTFDFFHPIHIYFIFYFFIFFITPLYLIDAKDTLCVDDNVMGACINATIIVTLALLFFSFGYSITKIKDKYPLKIKDIETTTKKRILKKSYLLFSIFYIISLYYALSSGKTLLGILSLGNINPSNTPINYGNDAMLFMINVSYSLLVPWLFIFTYAKNKVIPIILSFLLISLFFSYGWRFIIYILIISFLITRVRILNKRIKISQIIIVTILLFFFSVFTGVVRNNIRSGNNIDFEGFTTENIKHTLESNFNIYQTFYGVVDTYPEKHDFFYGKACFVYPFVMWIPRAIWPEKPQATEYPAGIALLNSCPSALKEAMSFPNIYEYYIDFGCIGVIVISFIIGIICKRMIQLYNSNSIFKVISYAIFIGFLIQFINRGYIAQLITLFIFLYLPLFLYKKEFRNI